jgi:TOTE conflict system, Archaeo-Eukaryotic Primase domain
MSLSVLSTAAGNKPQRDPWVRLADLYKGRRDVQGTESGACLKKYVTWGHYRGHLQGHLGLGIYPLHWDGTCAWAAVDIDTGDLDRALQLQRLLGDHELHAIVLTSRSKGYHVVVFFERRVVAADIRRVLRALIVEVGLAPQTEIFPKTDTPGPDSVAAGGYLRLPYLGALAQASETGTRPRYVPERGRRVALDPQNPMRILALPEFLDLAEANRANPDIVGKLADELDPQPVKEKASESRERHEFPPDPAVLGVSKEIAELIRDGWSGNSGYRSRSEAQQAVADALKAQGLSDEVARTVLTHPGYGISDRALKQSLRKREDAIGRSLKKATSRTAASPGTAAWGLTPELHRRMIALRLAPLCWPVVVEIWMTTDRQTGLSFISVDTIASRLRRNPSTIYRSAITPLREAGFLEAVPQPAAPGSFPRVGYRLLAAGPLGLLVDPSAMKERLRPIKSTGSIPARGREREGV